MKRLLYILLTAAALPASAQFYVDGATVHNDGATLFISSDVTNNSGLINNLGNTYINGDFAQTNTLGVAPVISNQTAADTIFSRGNFDITTGFYEGSLSQYGYTGTLVFDGSAPQSVIGKTTSNDNFYHMVVNNTSGTTGDVLIKGIVSVENSLRFTDGVVQVASTDTLIMFSDAAVLGTPGVNSHVNGELFREGGSAVGDLFFPIGDGASYRPVWAKNVTVTAPLTIMGFSTVPGAVGATTGLGIEELVNTRYWRGTFSDDYVPGQLELSFGAPEAITDETEIVVAQSDAPNGEYVNLDQSAYTTTSVTSEFDAGAQYFMIGKSANLRVDLDVFLEGAFDTGTGIMDDSLYNGSFGNILANNYQNGHAGANPYGLEMVNNYNLGPTMGADPVDVVMLTIRDVAAPAVDIDTTYGWLMSDGSIRDFNTSTKPFVTFSDLSLNTTTNYSIVVWHRNHVPLMFESTGRTITQSTSTPVNFDFTNPVNVYGVGYKDLFGDASTAGMYIGNAEQVWSPMEVNAADLYVVANDAQNNLPSGYLIGTDVDLNGVTNQTDWDKTKWANDQLYFSTVP